MECVFKPGQTYKTRDGREAHQVSACGEAPHWTAEMIWYRADDLQIWLPAPVQYEGRCTFGLAWRSSIHMPRWASRLTLLVTDVRVQRLQEISRGDAMSEGCTFPNMAKGDDPRQWYAELWEQINGRGSWDANPWVVALTFAVQRRNIDAKDAA